MKTWTAPHLREFLASVQNDRLRTAWTLIATTGLRRGEASGLRWDDVDLEGGQIAVRQTLVNIAHKVRFSEPKTKAGQRSVALDQWTVVALREHRRRQLEERLAWGPAWSDSELVFTREDGQFIHPGGFSKRFDRRSVLLAVLPAGAAQAESPLKGVTDYVFVGHLGTFDSEGRGLAWEGTISGDIEGTIEWWTNPPVPPIPTGQASHYSELVIITTSDGFLVVEDTGSTTTRHAKNSNWRTNGVVTDASEEYESWIGRRVHASGHFTWLIPGVLPAAGGGIFRLN